MKEVITNHRLRTQRQFPEGKIQRPRREVQVCPKGPYSLLSAKDLHSTFSQSHTPCGWKLVSRVSRITAAMLWNQAKAFTGEICCSEMAACTQHHADERPLDPADKHTWDDAHIRPEACEQTRCRHKASRLPAVVSTQSAQTLTLLFKNILV